MKEITNTILNFNPVNDFNLIEEKFTGTNDTSIKTPGENINTIFNNLGNLNLNLSLNINSNMNNNISNSSLYKPEKYSPFNNSSLNITTAAQSYKTNLKQEKLKTLRSIKRTISESINESYDSVNDSIILRENISNVMIPRSSIGNVCKPSDKAREERVMSTNIITEVNLISEDDSFWNSSEDCSVQWPSYRHENIAIYDFATITKNRNSTENSERKPKSKIKLKNITEVVSMKKRSNSFLIKNQQLSSKNLNFDVRNKKKKITTKNLEQCRLI
jgi:hypothetical protein